MKQEQNAKLLQAYREAINVGQYSIADALEDIILEEMDETRPSHIFFKESRTTTEPPWKVTCGPDVVSTGAKMQCTGIDHLSKETTA